MLLNIRPTIFLNELTFEVHKSEKCMFRAILRDDKGVVCSALENESDDNRSIFKWSGLNDLPYGVYTFEISGGSQESKTRLIKMI